MDAVTGATATKVLDTFKSLPTWLLLGLSGALLLIWFSPSILASLPVDLQLAMPAALVPVLVLTICNVLGWCVTHLVERQMKARDRDRERLLHLYRPLISLFLTRHITVSTGAASPYLRHRMENAWDALTSSGRRWRRVKRAWRALFDKQISSSAEVEYGGDFPLDKIIALVRANLRYAEPELQDLISHADRSRYEEYDRAAITDAEYALFDHINRMHRRLSTRAG
ncbi:hypothetical protein [Bradyrhizobium sp. 33ap4]|uniref:hypothetical protein n=1 Tax=Bradyrhizobium sp. 33ap4 TaxID=3061630 RepID=UPI002930C0AC|nr:hypothetical protein [Bradyrhizobium sp. 33ap4]